jgi:hypothetical protein
MHLILSTIEEKELSRFTFLFIHRAFEFESRWGQEFSLLQIVQTGSEVHPTSYLMGIFPRG